MPGEAQHVYVVVRVTEGDRARRVYPSARREAQSSGLGAIKGSRPLRNAAGCTGDEEPATKRILRLLEPAFDFFGVIHKHELGRLHPGVQASLPAPRYREPGLFVTAAGYPER